MRTVWWCPSCSIGNVWMFVELQLTPLSASKLGQVEIEIVREILLCKHSHIHLMLIHFPAFPSTYPSFHQPIICLHPHICFPLPFRKMVMVESDINMVPSSEVELSLIRMQFPGPVPLYCRALHSADPEHLDVKHQNKGHHWTSSQVFEPTACPSDEVNLSNWRILSFQLWQDHIVTGDKN